MVPWEGGSSTKDRRMTGNRTWRARPVATVLVKGLILLVPIAAGTLAGFVVADALPVPAGTPAKVAWSLVVLGTSTLTLIGVERLTRRLAPLALLLRLSLVFPDQAPKRFGLALRAIRPGRAAVDADEPAAGASLALLASLLAHDRRTRGHSERVAAYARMICDGLGLSDEERDRITWGALLHDIGKLEVPTRILNKPGKLDEAEWRIMARHPAFGAALVDPLRPWLGDALTAVDGHHERFDGTGYPYRRRSGDLPLAARVVALADAFEVMTAARSYKAPMSVAAGRAEVAACAGGHFDPQVARAFLGLSVPQLWRVAGPLAWLAQVPLIGLVVRGDVVPSVLGPAVQNAAMVTTQAVATAAMVGGALVATGALGGRTDGTDRDPAMVEQAAGDDAAAGADGPDGTADESVTTSGPAGQDRPAGDVSADGRGPGGGQRGDVTRGDGDASTPDDDGGGGGRADPAPPTDDPGPTPAAPGPTDPTPPGGGSGGGGGGGGGGAGRGPLGGIVDPIVDGVDDVVGGVTGADHPVGGIVDPVVDGADDVVGGLLGGLGRH
jgi:HD-GYP domain-containing protein (c-di-GMP phosphodiesterase class II)